MTARRFHAILHIGIGKTGTTTIQHALKAARPTLPELGFCYPRTPGTQLHTALCAYAEAAEPPPPWRRRRLPPPEPDFEQRLGEEIAALPASVHTLVFSSEALATLHSAAQLARLRALLDPSCASYRVLVYLRRQDEWAVSNHTQLARIGKDRPVFHGEPRDFAPLLDRWAAAFGRDAVAPRIFSRSDLAEGDVLADFCAACGLPRLPPARDTPLNPALRAEAQAFLRQLGALARARRPGFDPLGLPGYWPMVQRLNDAFAGHGPLPTRAEAEAYYAQCRAANERVRAAWFPQRDTLFPEDFSRYPEQAPPPPSAEQLLEVAARALAALLEHDEKSRAS